MERHEAEQTVVEEPRGPRRRRPAEAGPSRRILAIAVVLSLVAFAALGVVILNAGDEPVEVADPPSQSWDSIEPGEGTPIDLGNGRRAATVIVSAQQDVCWTGYIVSQAVEGCGTKQFDVTGARAVLGANVRHMTQQRAFIGIAAWSASGNQRLTGDTSRKPLAVVSITAYPPKPEK